MKRKHLSLALVLMMLLPISLAAMSDMALQTNAATEKVVFVRDGGTGDGGSAEKPLGKLEDAYAALGDEGGRIVICGKYTMTAPFQEPVHTGTVAVTQNYNDLDYREGTSLYTGGAGRRYILNGPTVFENINFSTANKGGLFIIAQYNRVELGEGVSCEGFDGSLVASAVTILGGEQQGLAPLKKNDGGSHIIVKSGQEILIAGLCRQTTTDNARSSKIEIYGGEIKTLYSGNINGGKGDSSEIIINGGKFTGKLSCEYGLSGKVKVTVNGGDFSACSSVTGTAVDSEIIIAESVEKQLTPLVSGFKTVTTSTGTVVHKIPEEVFGSGSFISSDGTVLPYRIYYPEGYETSSGKYPIFVYFHGNGSRGTDNKAQLGANHAIVSKVLNSGTDCVIIAPQAPKTSAWILDSEYPGGTGFDNTAAPPSPYLSAAIELINKMLEDEKIDTNRLYLGGGSNGAAACWSVISRNPRSVAAAVIQAGTGATGASEKVAEACLYTPIWTFHGDADKTLSVEGTREIVNKVKDLGGTLIKYTEMPGRGHDIWLDAANTEGLLDWMLGQKRTDTSMPLLKVLDTAALEGSSQGGVDFSGTETTDTSAATDTPATDKTPVTTGTAAVSGSDTANSTTANTAEPSVDEGGNTVLPIVIAVVAAAAVVAAVVVVIIKKKKQQNNK